MHYDKLDAEKLKKPKTRAETKRKGFLPKPTGGSRKIHLGKGKTTRKNRT